MCAKRPTNACKETYACMKRDLLMRVKGPTNALTSSIALTLRHAKKKTPKKLRYTFDIVEKSFLMYQRFFERLPGVHCMCVGGWADGCGCVLCVGVYCVCAFFIPPLCSSLSFSLYLFCGFMQRAADRRTTSNFTILIT
jgi:hypothetical protein